MPATPSPLVWRRALESASVILFSDDPEQHPAKTLHRPRSSLPIGVGNARALRLRQLAFKLAALCREVEKSLPPIASTLTLEDKPLPDQLAKNAIQALLCNTQSAEQFAHRYLRMSSDEMDDAMMRAPKSVLREDRIGLCGEIAIGKEQQFDPLPHLILGLGRCDDE